MVLLSAKFDATGSTVLHVTIHIGCMRGLILPHSPTSEGGVGVALRACSVTEEPYQEGKLCATRGTMDARSRVPYGNTAMMTRDEIVRDERTPPTSVRGDDPMHSLTRYRYILKLSVLTHH
ncbi:hypothetical protein MRX96_039508 [Rhipicephalus microplus]